jgi:hypothetical protein
MLILQSRDHFLDLLGLLVVKVKRVHTLETFYSLEFVFDEHRSLNEIKEVKLQHVQASFYRLSDKSILFEFCEVVTGYDGVFQLCLDANSNHDILVVKELFVPCHGELIVDSLYLFFFQLVIVKVKTD